MTIKPINHYAIPTSCVGVGTGSCPLKNVDLSSVAPKAWEPRYTELEVNDTHLLRDDSTGEYTPQGACTDGTYIYRALVASDELPTMLQKISIATGEIVTQVTNTSYGHANDMAYAEGYLYIAHSSSTSIVYKVDPVTFSLVDTFNLPTTIWGIDYDPTNKLFVIGGVGSAYFSVYYNDFSFMYRIKPQNAYTGMVRQTIHCDSNYIYVALDNAYGTIIENEMGSRVMVYTWNGIFIKSIHIPIPEIEWCFELSGKLYFGTYEGRDSSNIKHGKIYAIPFDMYPEQTVITGRPTEVSGGINNLQRLPEGTPVRLWTGSIKEGSLTLDSASTSLKVDEDSPFRYLRFRFKGANQQVFDWYPLNAGTVALREVDITAAESDTNLRVREMTLLFNPSTQVFTVERNVIEAILYDKSEDKIVVTKTIDDSTSVARIELTQIWGIV